MPWNQGLKVMKNLVQRPDLARRIFRSSQKFFPKMMRSVADSEALEAHEALVEETLGLDLLPIMSRLGSAVVGNWGCLVVLAITIILAAIALFIITLSYLKSTSFRFDSSSEASWIYDQRVPPQVRDKLEFYYRVLEEGPNISREQKWEELFKELQDIINSFPIIAEVTKSVPPDIPTGEDVNSRQDLSNWARRRITEIIRSNGLQDVATSLKAATDNYNGPRKLDHCIS